MIVGLIPDRLKRAPNAKMFLRSFWYRATLREVALPDEMHIYTLARSGPLKLISAWQRADQS